MQAWFISDVHLKGVTERNAVTLIRFMQELRENPKATHLILLGDIFDLWISDGPIYIRRFQSVIDEIAALKEKGLEIIYFEGNHDVHVQDFWQDKMGIATFADDYLLNWGPYKIRLEHGDLINPDDKTYLQYRSIIRHPILEKLAPTISLVTGPILDAAGNLASQWSRKRSYEMREELKEELRRKIRTYAKNEFKKAPSDKKFDLLITGHMHIRDDYTFEVGQKKVRSINLGSWFDQPMALKVEEDLSAEFVVI